MTAGRVGRLPPPHGAWIDRARPVAFEFDGRRYSGFAGDTAAAALAAHGVFLLSRSFKYHRARGARTMAGADANALVQWGGEPNAPADVLEVTEGMRLAAQNVFGSLRHDRGRVIQAFSRFLPVGFYYRAFYAPRGAWERWWEPVFRRAAGLGRVDVTAGAEEGAGGGGFDKCYEFCDVAVVGGGAAGLAAAAAAAEGGGDVRLFEAAARVGGALNYARLAVDDVAARERGAALRGRLVAAAEAAGVRMVSGAAVTGWFADNYLSVVRGTRLYKVRAGRVVYAAGAEPQPLVFRNNDLPGVMQGSAAQRLIRLYGVRPGTRAVVATAGAEGYAVCLDLLEAGVAVAAVADLRPAPSPHPFAEAVAARGVRVWAGYTVYEAVAGAGGRHVVAAAVRPIVGRGECRAGGDTLECDLICMCVGDVPAWHLPCMAGGRLVFDEVRGCFGLGEMPAHAAAVGAAAGTGSFARAVVEGRAAGRRLGGGGGAVAEGGAADVVEEGGGGGEAVPWHVFSHPRGREFVDFDEDLQVRDIVEAAAAGYDHVQLAKRFSTAGMGPSQGRHAALAVARILAAETGTAVGEVGVTTARPPAVGEKLGVLAGRAALPERRTPMHELHRAAGARFMPAGTWWRPAFYGRGAPGREEARAAAGEEALAVRGGVGMCDVSTLGGLEISGADAAVFLERMYTGRFARLPVGRAKYALMTSERGAVADDGVACRLREDLFYVTATTAGAAAVYREMLRWRAVWRLRVEVVNVTSAWAAVNVAGPGAREVLRRAGSEVDVAGDAFGFMAVRTGTVAGIAARMIRTGFVGETGFEIHVPASYGAALWEALAAAGAAEEMRFFGVEAQRLLRLEKGHFIVGQDSDSLTTPRELGMDWAVAAEKDFFVGGRALAMLAAREKEGGRRLVGFEVFEEGVRESHLVFDAAGAAPVGRVTSCAYSPTLRRWVGLAYAPAALAAPGCEAPIRGDGGKRVVARVVRTPFYDAAGERQK